MKILYFIPLLIFFSCDIHDHPTKRVDPDFFELMQCSKNKDQISSIVESKLVGSWIWYKRICSKTLQPDFEGDLGLSVDLKMDSSYVLFQNDSIIQTGKWNISSDLNKIQTNPRINQFDGNFEMCPDKFVCNNLGLDICANFFKRDN